MHALFGNTSLVTNHQSNIRPRFKHLGLIYLGLLCFLGNFTASIQCFAQSVTSELIARHITLDPSALALNGIPYQIGQKGFATATRWDNSFVTPGWMSASWGGKFYIQGRLMGRNPNGSYSPLPNQTVYLVLQGGVKTYSKVTNKDGWVYFNGYFQPAPGMVRPGTKALLQFTWVYRPNNVFAPSQSNFFLTVTN